MLTNHYIKYSESLKIGKKSKYFSKIFQDISKPKGYVSFEEVAACQAFIIDGIRQNIEMLGDRAFNLLRKDPAWIQNIVAAHFVAENVVPVRYLAKELFEAFSRSSVEASDLKIPLPYGILMLPEGLTSPDGQNLNWLFFRHLPKGSYVETLTFGKYQLIGEELEVEKLLWTAVLSQGMCYSSCIEIEEEIKRGGFFLGDFTSASDIEAEEAFRRSVESILLQFLLYLDVYPEDVSEAKSTDIDTRGQGFSGGKDKPKAPIFVGERFVAREKQERKSREHKSHKSPEVHWRRGHWRRVCVGENREERRWHWFKPVLVNPSINS